ncbi:tetratricopeptide repeat protein [Rhodobacter maris]|uniref:TPR repeat protein n=1 Tax=Rhodobacter maris TaxID=446682 RepID=A0A285SCZ0_9RHOB|nr:tetratricopeptide repeat protein [Rhodobacter maris]SOC05622.1 TPR repeat protein [Rhodobacter maris]
MSGFKAVAQCALVRFGVALALVAPCAAPVVAQAQDVLAGEQARYEEAESYRSGSNGPVDLGRARVLHEALVAEGYAPSLVRLADIYEQLGRSGDAIATYDKAIDAGSAYARVRLATGHLQGRFGTLSDPVAGVAQLRDIVNRSGDELAALSLADAYVAGTGTPPDIAQAVAIYEKLSQRGYALADLRLGKLYAEPTVLPQDLPRAIDHFTRAVSEGSDAARVELSKALIAAHRGEEALRVIDAAVARGLPRAEALRAVWHHQGAFGPLSDPAFGAREMRRLAESGDVYAARNALIAHERRSRRIRDLDLEKVLATLQGAADAGDRQALISLARAYRKLAWTIPGAREKQRALVENHGAELGDEYESAERLEVLYDRAHPVRSREAAYAYLETLDGQAFGRGLMRLRAIEMQAYVYVLERELAAHGYVTGTADGILDRVTLTAAQKFCRDEGIWDVCQHGPLTYDSSTRIVGVLANERRPR